MSRKKTPADTRRSCSPAFRLCMTPLAFSIAIVAGSLPASSWAQETPISIAISPQPLGQALLQLGKQAGLQLFFSQETVAGYDAPAISGSLSPDEALQRLLAGTGIQFRRTGANVTLSRAAPPANAVAHLETVTVTAERTKDEVGHDKVYHENTTSIYQDREQLQRFQATNPGDVFKGMNGVYSMDTRSSQAITPNIRGITGEGRTPLTIDGTEQSTNVWLHAFGVGNRSYADPALFRSIEVEKGPSLSRGIKSGVGGAVNIRTIEASDIIADGESWGIEANLRASSNTKNPRYDATSLYGQDYRDLSGAQLNGVVVSPYLKQPRTQNNGNFNLDDHAEMLTIAARNDFMDILLSRSERTSGNYYAGKNNVDRYLGHDPYDTRSTKVYTPNLAKLYGAGSEVFSTASETGTTLIKNNWYLPDQQRIGLQFMRTDTTFGETTPGSSILTWGYLEDIDLREPDRDRSQETVVYENPHSKLRLDSYKLSYDIKPEGSNWLNLETSLWHTKAEGIRYQTGSSPYAIDMDEQTQTAMQSWRLIKEMYESLGMPFVPGMPWYNPEPDHDGTIVANGRQWTSHDRTGFDFSNLMRLSSTLQLTLAGSYQKEKLDDRVELSKSVTNGLAPDGSLLNIQTDRLGPRSGERKEYSAMMNLAWQANDWLTLTAGTRYLRYSGKDTGLAKLRRQRSEFHKATRRATGLELQYLELMTPEDKAELIRLRAEATAASIATDMNDPSNFKEWTFRSFATDGPTPYTTSRFPTENPAFRMAAQNLLNFLSERRANPFGNTDQIEYLGETAAEIGIANLFVSGGYIHSPARDSQFATDDWGSYWIKTALLPNKDGKFDSSQNPFANGELDASEMVDDPYNPGNTVSRAKGGEIRTRYELLDSGKAWEMPQEQSGSAFSPVFTATAKVGPFGTAFVRYAQTTRFPNINELTSSAIVDGNGLQGSLAAGASKPERSTNWEVGYAHDLTQFFPSLGFADVRVSYYDTEIRDFIERARLYDLIQYDKKKTSGVELQSRFDSGRYFGSLGATYRLKQKLCDKDYASELDPFYNRIPHCMTGGFPGTYSGSSLQPKYSIDLLLGTRLLNGRLELGWRSVYHAGAENKQLDRLLASEAGPDYLLPRDVWFRGGVDTFHWRSVLLHDFYANFNVNKHVSLNLGITNLTNEYYLDPMSKVLLPGPGRTVTAGMKISF
ncbi:TonB-dependent receptor [Thauera sp. Sel9]|uniref:TonB-dependent receptor n=1 Tax=Thauera sp. Sel9 TaxID=2974299 RepID=UPI0021E17A8C|nr:TonB-dependent receptor [Thauera sp. Sel9]MCV2218543.1 TonB-dependent receptor [Thauera sp. Sel9]